MHILLACTCLRFCFVVTLMYTQIWLFMYWQGLSKSTLSSKFSTRKLGSKRYGDLPVGYRPVRVDWKDLDKCSVCHMDEVKVIVFSIIICCFVSFFDHVGLIFLLFGLASRVIFFPLPLIFKCHLCFVLILIMCMLCCWLSFFPHF